ncbi:hypothetical protein Q0590_36275 [Rhodocytophaga aerolata]|uniref:Uncharacterized protein n=1 Tax=Rhodocytophaga aerolata TaxID=455078 RepID=A0ABT8RI63_9BACT|nr:hypothetical protein [Rhodocytophaga aerolata]MDO1451788.1 hypothetical protein [Rhodocytophaga aerolata]
MEEAVKKKALIKQECEGHGPFLYALKASMESQFLSNKVSQGDIILKIQSIARTHYQCLWKACTREEQYILYDIAQDGLVNSKNTQVIIALIEKGLLVYDGTLWIMNHSFRNYILTTISPEEVSKMKSEALTSGAWSAIKGPLILVVIALVGFLSLTQQETYKQAIALLGTLTATIPIMIQLLGSSSPSLGKGVEKE